MYAIFPAVGILDVEDGPSRVDEDGKGRAFVVLGALLIDGKAKDRESLRDDVARFSMSDRHVVPSLPRR